MVHDLADQIAQQVTLSPLGSKKVRVFEVDRDGRRQREFTGTEMLGNLSDVDMYAEVRPSIYRSRIHRNSRSLIIQEVPLEELNARETDKIIDVFHFTKEPSRTHGVPFRFVLLPVCSIHVLSWSSSMADIGHQ
jgi:ubiquitin carboxyl-terminal hydrolase 7